jgi:hypothetical protein
LGRTRSELSRQASVSMGPIFGLRTMAVPLMCSDDHSTTTTMKYGKIQL